VLLVVVVVVVAGIVGVLGGNAGSCEEGEVVDARNGKEASVLGLRSCIVIAETLLICASDPLTLISWP
jgi:hypothetical protein